ncbi:hypothetical protein DY000_02007259 [Brassica cretica]|uniref:Uncharacterized protein n=1 Tax=Brassica cretica TaxID=69181 RepID=A0ABQ7CAN8_BRACR|nr:hypothetical protein DY000_02007259 [Brassica cretica]
MGVRTPVPSFAAFHVWISKDYEGPRCTLGCTRVLGSFDSILRLAVAGHGSTSKGMLIWLFVSRADPRLARASACEFCSLGI